MTGGGKHTASRAAVLVVVLITAFLGLTAAAEAGRSHERGTVTGVVVYGPFVPTDRAAGVAWPPEEAVVWAYLGDATEPVRTLFTGSDGRFTVRLKPGRYRFSAQPAGVSILPICHDVTVKVTAGRATFIRLWLDSGLRFPDAENVKPGETPGGHQKYRQGLEGTTRRGPIVPVARPEEPSDEPCAATLTVYRFNGKRGALVHSTEADGFAVSLPAGRYIVDPRSAVSDFDRAGPFSIRVPRREWLSLTIVFDTGIRFAGAAQAPR